MLPNELEFKALSLVTFLFLGLGPTACRGDELDPKNTYALIVGVLTWQQDSLTKYDADNRQDQRLRDQLVRTGVPEENIELLLDQHATRASITHKLKTLASRAEEGSTLIVYYAGHGMIEQGEGVFACYDINTQKMLQTGWRHGDLLRDIRDNFRGKNVLLLADCCYSGALEKVVSELGKQGFNAASLTSATDVNTSTGNWTYTHSLIEAVTGQLAVDRNGDGAVTLAESANYVQQSMKYFERQRFGHSAVKLPSTFVLSRVRDQDRGTAREWQQYSIGDFVSAKVDGRKRVGRIVGGKSNDEASTLLVQFQKYSETPRIWVSLASVTPASEPKLRPAKPEPLSAKDAASVASVDGKYSQLLKQIHVERDFITYGAFNDYGKSFDTSYAGQANLPPGYWVYAYPYWHIWKNGPNDVRVGEQKEPAPVLKRNLAAYDPKQMTGVPDTPKSGDFGTAWASKLQDATKAWVEVDYAKAIDVRRVDIYESYNPGAVYQITGLHDGKETLLWKGADPTDRSQKIGVSRININPEQGTSTEFRTLRIYLNCPAVPGWNEIDAVAVIDVNNETSWAVDARASTTFGQNNDVKFTDPFQTPHERLREQTNALRRKIDQGKQKIRLLEKQMDLERRRVKQLLDQLDSLKQ